jgi:hypothetical protein
VTEHVTQNETTTEDDWVISAGALTHEGRVYVPDSPGLLSRGWPGHKRSVCFN